MISRMPSIRPSSTRPRKLTPEMVESRVQEVSRSIAKLYAQEQVMSWQSFMVPVLGGFIIMGTCYLIGHLGLSFMWILLLVALNVLKSYMWKQREKRLMALRQTALKEREVILAQLQDLPAWVQFPDTERVEWLNKVILQLWPYIGEYAKRFLQEYIEPQMKAQLPALFSSFRFVKMDMGDIPCRVGGIKVYTHNVGRDRIIVDMDVTYAGDAEFDVSVAGFTGGLNQLQAKMRSFFSGKLRAVLKPLLPFPPMIGGVSGFFMERPRIDFNLTGMGEFVELPGLINAIRSIIDDQVSKICVLPNEVVIALAPNVDVTKLYFPEPDGVLRLKVIEAKNLENRDISFVKKMKSDPYCVIQIGSQMTKTRIIDNNLNPIWNEYFEFMVDQADGQHLRMELFDYDTASSDEELGRLDVKLLTIKNSGYVDSWFPLDGCKHGDIHIQGTWMSLSSSLYDLQHQEWESSWMNADKPVHPAILMLFIDNVSNLPYPRAKLEPSPYLMVSVGKDCQQTPVKVKTTNPLFQTKFIFFLRRPEGQDLKISALDNTTKRTLGELTIPLQMLLDEPNLEIVQQTYALSYGVHQSPIVITARIRALVSEKMRRESVSSSFDAKGGHFANVVHIERANESPPIEEISPSPNGFNVASSSDAVFKNRLESPLANHPQPSHRDSNNSLSSAVRRRQTFGERLFSPKHAQSRGSFRGMRGKLHFGLKHVNHDNRLVVHLCRVTQLQPFAADGSADPYITLKLVTIDNTHSPEKRRTPIIKQCLDPTFDNEFEFSLHRNEVSHYELVFIVKDATNYGAFSKSPIYGKVNLQLDSLNLTEDFVYYWFDLEASK